ncbi:MAG TPA: hypothetical protein VK158_04825 [Acidobacteriota bacterium]|nr:hypothetical protein [Acidobacteriota bacterium]
MRHIPRVILGVFTILLLALTACTSGQQGGDVTSPFIGGTNALEMSFITGAPPAEIYDNKDSKFAISLQLRNSGEADIDTNDGYVQITGISPNEFGLSYADLKQNMPAIKGAKKSSNGQVTQGRLDVITFDGLSYQQNIVGNIGSSKVRAIACYNYKTRASADVCVKESSVDELDRNSVCTLAGSKNFANSGGPLQIVSATQNPVGGQKVQMTFEIASKAGSSDLFMRKDTECNDQTNNPDMYKVWVNVLPINNNAVSANCNQFGGGSSGYITLYNGQPQPLICDFTIGSVTSDFVTRVNVELEYRMMQFIEKPILIKDVTEND